MNIALQFLGIAVQVAGLAILYLHWRAKRGLGGALLVAGWALIALGALPWLMHVSIERGLALAMLAPMAGGLLFLTPDGLARIGNGAAPRKARGAQAPPEAESTVPGRISRNIARWIGALLAAPALALAAMAAWQAFVPGVNADRFAFSIFALMIAWNAALLWLLATMRPWRATLVTALAAFVLGGGAYLFASGGAA